MIKKLVFITCFCTILSSCNLFQEEDIYEIDDGKGIHFIFDSGLNDDPTYALQKDANGQYFFILSKEGQNIQRISGRLLNSNNQVIYSKANGPRQTIEFKNNLFWWILKGQTVANITKTYFNPFLGEIQYVNLPPLINWKDELVPTINSTAMTNDLTGRFSVVIAPVGSMKGETMTIYVKYTHPITQQKLGSSFFTSLGSKEIIDSVKIKLL
jgi:hypothetical protein